jgi:hypothetical protein
MIFWESLRSWYSSHILTKIKVSDAMIGWRAGGRKQNKMRSIPVFVSFLASSKVRFVTRS